MIQLVCDFEPASSTYSLVTLSASSTAATASSPGDGPPAPAQSDWNRNGPEITLLIGGFASE